MSYLWLAVTSDKYELPICVASSAIELSKKMGTTTNNIYNSILRKCSGRNNGYKYIKIKIEEC